MSIEKNLPIPDTKKLSTWLEQWGQALSQNAEFLGNYAEDVAIHSVSNANPILWFGCEAIRGQARNNLKAEGIDLDALKQGHPIATLIAALRAQRDGYEPRERAEKILDKRIIASAEDYFAEQAACSPVNSDTFHYITRAWNSYCDMLGIAPSPLPKKPAVAAAAEWIRNNLNENARDTTLYDAQADNIIEQNLQNLGHALGMEIGFCHRNKHVAGEIRMGIDNYGDHAHGKPWRKTQQNEHKIRKLLTVLCQALNTEILGSVRIADDEVGFTLGCNMQDLVAADGRVLEKRAFDSHDLLVNADIDFSYPADKKERCSGTVRQHDAEEAINAAFLGARLGVPESIAIDRAHNIIAVTLHNEALHHQRRLEAACAALKETGLKFTLQGTSPKGDLIGLKLMDDNIECLERANLGSVTSRARHYLLNRLSEDLPGLKKQAVASMSR